jgi:hypothetical protein
MLKCLDQHALDQHARRSIVWLKWPRRSDFAAELNQANEASVGTRDMITEFGSDPVSVDQQRFDAGDRLRPLGRPLLRRGPLSLTFPESDLVNMRPSQTLKLLDLTVQPDRFRIIVAKQRCIPLRSHARQLCIGLGQRATGPSQRRFRRRHIRGLNYGRLASGLRSLATGHLSGKCANGTPMRGINACIPRCGIFTTTAPRHRPRRRANWGEDSRNSFCRHSGPVIA